MKLHKVIIADDHAVVRQGIKSFIEDDKRYSVVATANNGEELLALLKTKKCDIAVIDISMPRMDGLSAAKEIRKSYPSVKVLIMSMLKDYEHFERAIAAGAAGYLVKDDAGDEIIKALSCIVAEKKYISPLVQTLLAERQIRSFDDGEVPSLNILTNREKEILVLIGKGLANKEIAARLHISVRTVENHRQHMIDKLGLRTTAALVKYAISKGLA